jgi:hypothetical protein
MCRETAEVFEAGFLVSVTTEKGSKFSNQPCDSFQEAEETLKKRGFRKKACGVNLQGQRFQLWEKVSKNVRKA